MAVSSASSTSSADSLTPSIGELVFRNEETVEEDGQTGIVAVPHQAAVKMVYMNQAQICSFWMNQTMQRFKRRPGYSDMFDMC